MRYDIVSIIIAAAVAILLLVFNASLSKDDKYFMSAIIVILILTGLYFSIKDTNIKNKDSETQSVKLDTTITNTKILKEKSDFIIADLNQNLDRVIKINDDLKGFNGQLQSIEKEVEEQIGLLRNTLNQTKVFEEKVSEQLRLEKKKFALDRPIIKAWVDGFVPAIKEGKLGIKYSYINAGKRGAIDNINNHMVLYYNSKNGIYHRIKRVGESSKMVDLVAGGGKTSFTFNTDIDEEILGKEVEVLVLVLVVEYKDEATKDIYYETFTFYCNNLKYGDKTFNVANPSFIEISKTYLKDNGFTDFYK
ncbi:hypothetical protein J4E06_12225 [Muricauda sp. NFXS6]|uniref:hypothetical protein n=1 Tax=Allomuricauda sp. NFXS6 TaxID=2819094 RepID=UPI0032DE98A9